MKPKKTTRLDTRLTPEEREKVQEYCANKNIKMSQFVRDAIAEKLARN